jgi:hypothetical protein
LFVQQVGRSVVVHVFFAHNAVAAVAMCFWPKAHAMVLHFALVEQQVLMRPSATVAYVAVFKVLPAGQVTERHRVGLVSQHKFSSAVNAVPIVAHVVDAQ